MSRSILVSGSIPNYFDDDNVAKKLKSYFKKEEFFKSNSVELVTPTDYNGEVSSDQEESRRMFIVKFSSPIGERFESGDRKINFGGYSTVVGLQLCQEEGQRKEATQKSEHDENNEVDGDSTGFKQKRETEITERVWRSTHDSAEGKGACAEREDDKKDGETQTGEYLSEAIVRNQRNGECTYTEGVKKVGENECKQLPESLKTSLDNYSTESETLKVKVHDTYFPANTQEDVKCDKTVFPEESYKMTEELETQSPMLQIDTQEDNHLQADNLENRQVPAFTSDEYSLPSKSPLQVQGRIQPGQVQFQSQINHPNKNSKKTPPKPAPKPNKMALNQYLQKKKQMQQLEQQDHEQKSNEGIRIKTVASKYDEETHEIHLMKNVEEEETFFASDASKLQDHPKLVEETFEVKDQDTNFPAQVHENVKCDMKIFPEEGYKKANELQMQSPMLQIDTLENTHLPTDNFEEQQIPTFTSNKYSPSSESLLQMQRPSPPGQVLLEDPTKGYHGFENWKKTPLESASTPSKIALNHQLQKKVQLDREPIIGEDSEKATLIAIEVSWSSDGINKETIELYFENERKSGGGDVKKFEHKDEKSSIVIFEDPEVAKRVLGQKQHVINNVSLTVKEKQMLPTDKTSIVLEGIPDYSKKDELEMYLENCTGIEESPEFFFGEKRGSSYQVPRRICRSESGSEENQQQEIQGFKTTGQNS